MGGAGELVRSSTTVEMYGVRGRRWIRPWRGQALMGGDGELEHSSAAAVPPREWSGARGRRRFSPWIGRALVGYGGELALVDGRGPPSQSPRGRR